MQKDKQLHLLCGFVIALVAGIIVSAPSGLAASIIAGAGKELYDYFHQNKHSVEFADFAFTVCGGAIGNMLCMVVV